MGRLRRGLPGQPIAQETRLGWIISGNTQSQGGETSRPACNAMTSSTIGQDGRSLSRLLQPFWELDEPTPRAQRSLVDAGCENLFVNEHRRRSDGR